MGRIIKADVREISLVDRGCVRRPWSILGKAERCAAESCTHRPQSLFKVDEARRELVGCVYPLTDSEHRDCQDDFIDDPNTLALARASWVRNHSVVKLLHSGDPLHGITVLKNWLTTEPLEQGGQSVPVGSWMLALRIDNDEIWTMISDKRLTGFSLGGVGAIESVKVEDETMCECKTNKAAETQEERDWLAALQMLRDLNAAVAAIPDATPNESTEEEQARLEAIVAAAELKLRSDAIHAQMAQQQRDAEELGLRMHPIAAGQISEAQYRAAERRRDAEDQLRMDLARERARNGD